MNTSKRRTLQRPSVEHWCAFAPYVPSMFILGFVFGLLSGVLLLLLLVVLFVFNFFSNKQTSDDHNAIQPISPQKTRIPAELKAFLCSCPDGVGSEWESCSSLNLLLHFLFQEHKDTRQFHRWFYKKLQLELNDVTARSGHEFSNELVLLLDVDYRGGFQMSVDALMAFGKFAQLSVKLLQLSGRARFSIRRQPFAHWSFSFIEAPQMELKIDSQFQGRNLRHLIPLIASAFRKAVQLKHSVSKHGCFRSSIEKRPFNPHKNSNKNATEKFREAAHLLSVLVQFSRKGTAEPLGLIFETKDTNGREVRVANVKLGSNAEKSGFRQNDTLVAVNNIPVRNERQATRLLTGTAGDLLVLVERELNDSANVTDELEEEEGTAKSSCDDEFDERTELIGPLERFKSFSQQMLVDADATRQRIVPATFGIFEAGQPVDDIKIFVNKRGKKAQRSKLSRSSERAAKISWHKGIRRSRSESELRNAYYQIGFNAASLLNEKISEEFENQNCERETPASEDVSGEREPKQNVSRREKFHAKANEMAVRLSKSKFNEFIWNRRKPVEMAVEAHDCAEAEEMNGAGRTERHRLEKPKRKWIRKKSPSSSIGLKLEQKMASPFSPKFDESAGSSKYTKSVQITRNPIWGQSLHFGLHKESLYLNVLLYATKNGQGQEINEEEAVLVGWTSIYVPRIVEDCTLTLSNCHRERFHLREPKSDHSPVSPEFEELSRHNGFDRRLCFGDLLIGFRFFPSGLPAELGESQKQTDDPSCYSSAASSQFEHRWIPLKHKQSFNVLCGICGGKIWLKWANQCGKCDLVCHAKCMERGQARECPVSDDVSALSFNDETFVELETTEIPERKQSDTSVGDGQSSSSMGRCPEAKVALSTCRRRRLAEKLQTISALTLKSVQEYSRRRTTQKGQPEEKENSASDLGSETPDSPKSPSMGESEIPCAMVSIAEVLELDLLNSLEGFGPTSQFSDLKFEPGNAYNSQVVCEAKVRGQHLFEWCESEERKRRINAQIDLVQAEIEAVTRLRRFFKNKTGADFERSEQRLQALAFIMMLYCYALNDCHEKEEEEAQKSKSGK
uniref:PDZ domain-containing protein 8 n=1 Tax=Globodera rostochiensis TaxID=31243 RepID=A0A914GXY3_GLORO